MKILIVEDNLVVMDLLVRLLIRMGHKVITALNGEEGLNRLNNTNVDIVLADIFLPRMNGIEMLKLWKKHVVSTAKVIVMTGYHQHEMVIPKWVDSFLEKPFRKEELLNALL